MKLFRVFYSFPPFFSKKKGKRKRTKSTNISQVSLNNNTLNRKEREKKRD